MKANPEFPDSTLFSIGATKRLIVAAETDDDLALLKGAALLYPRVVLATAAGPLNDIHEFIAKGLAAKQKADIRRFLQPIDNYTDKRSYSGEEFLNEALRTVGANQAEIINRFREVLRSSDKNPIHNPFKGKGLKDDPDPLFILYLSRLVSLPYYDSVEMGLKVSKFLDQVRFNVGEHEELATGIPAFGSLPWDVILELRESKFIDAFREYMFTSTLIPEEIQKGLWDIAGQVAPSRWGEILHKIIANIPMPGVPFLPNPYAVTRDYKDTKKQIQMFKKHGWLFFLQEARAKIPANETIQE